MLPQSFIDEVKRKTDLVKLVKEYVELTKAGNGIWQGTCPNPNHNDSDPSFRVWEKDQSWACYGCHYGRKDKDKDNKGKTVGKNYGSDCFAFYQWVENMHGTKITWIDAVMYLAKKAGVPKPDSELDKLYKLKKMLAISYVKSLKGNALDYLTSRGLNEDDILKWGLGFEGAKITFPLLDKYRNVLGFTKRWIVMPEGRSDKYKNSCNSKIFNKSYYLYGIHNFDDDFDEIRITEGPMDVIISEKYGVKNIVGTLGTAFTQGHIDIIKNLGKTPVFCMDGDGPGQLAILKAVNELAKVGIYSKVLFLPDEKDMADVANELKDGMEEYISNNAMTYGMYKMQAILSRYDAKMHEVKMSLFPEIKKIMNEIPDDEAKVINGLLKSRMQLEL